MPSGSLQFRVYTGSDAVTGKRHYLAETVSEGREVRRRAEKVRTRLLADLDADRSSLGRRPPSLSSWTATSRSSTSRSLPAPLRELDPHPHPPAAGRSLRRAPAWRGPRHLLRQLRTCRVHCRGARGLVDHRTRVPHECDRRCRPHQCRPPGPSGLRQAHLILDSAFAHTVRWEWLGMNPCARTVAPKAPAPKPQPPSAAQASTDDEQKERASPLPLAPTV